MNENATNNLIRDLKRYLVIHMKSLPHDEIEASLKDIQMRISQLENVTQTNQAIFRNINNKLNDILEAQELRNQLTEISHHILSK